MMGDDSHTEELLSTNAQRLENETFPESGRLAKDKRNTLSPEDKSFSEDENITHKMSSSAKTPTEADRKDEINALYSAIPELANHFKITCKIGEGAFSCVYLARLKHYPEVNEMFALKHIIPTTHPSRIHNELNCLLQIGGCDNVIDVKLCLRHREHVVLVMPVFLHDKFQEYLHNMSVDETREYMRNLLIALRRVHQFNIIHRDIKPSNFLYNRQQKKYALVDFGLASGPMLIDRDAAKLHKTALSHTQRVNERTVSGKSLRTALSPSKLDPASNNGNIMKPKTAAGKTDVGRRKSFFPGKTFALGLASTSAATPDSASTCDCFGKAQICCVCVSRPNEVASRAGTAGFRAPEVLMKYTDQGIAVDIWSAGVILLSILSARYPFFRAQDDMGYLAQIISILGSDICIQAASDIGKHLLVSESIPPVDLKSACMKLRMSQMSFKLGTSSQHQEVIQSWKTISDEPFDLLRRMLDPNPKTRITAEEALKHPFFL